MKISNVSLTVRLCSFILMLV